MDGFDTNRDGITDTYLYDTNGNNVGDVLGVDSDQNGIIDAMGIDSNENGIIDFAARDFNQDGFVDQLVADRNENGIDDAAEVTYPSPTVGVVGPPSTPSAGYGAGPFADEAQRIAFDGAMGYPDSDNDGFTDPNDGHPYDRDRR